MNKLTPIESEFETEEEAAAHDAWVRAKVEKALASKEPCIPHDQVMAEMRAIIDKHKNSEKAVLLSEFAADIERRRQETGVTELPRNSGKRRTASKKALLKAIEATGKRW